MFAINYCITTDKLKLKNISKQETDTGETIEGYFELVINGKKYGYCNMGDLRPGEEGMDLITTWFEGLLELLLKLREGSLYVAISDLESYNAWLEFKRLNSKHISIGFVRAKKWDGVEQITTNPLKNIEASCWTGEVVTYDEIFQEITKKAGTYITQVYQINPLILDEMCFIKLRKQLNMLT